MRALITNDDGIDSPGLAALARVAAAAGLEVVVAAPAHEHSGASASIIATEGTAVTAAGGKGTVRSERRVLPGVEEAYAVHAAPALIVLLALHGSFGAVPDVVLSGINRGANVGSAILHSGTVGAALTAGQGGVRALAVSLDVGLREGGDEHWETAAALAARALPGLLSSQPGTVHNLNVPDVDLDDGVELVEAPLAPFGIVQTTMTEVDGDEVRLAIREHRATDAPGSDMERLAAGLATITALPTLVTRAGEVPGVSGR
ncbi:5'/3'-nucleotidase SurE [Agrococcus sp. HG114]|uniref:5'/3'-nucleotidase SurE n=1 Tax=Agrococcus sp. HG114 TaxID=2969757 RepID=UPI00215B72DC|nr:5'/3'-nucleotidase SurE [Agrococcus sp. HG114]MCR8669915.1 5'/3'-nucleotidase SurE [Agrococcus sp. HG114]